MSAESPAVVHSFRVGKRTVTITIPYPELDSCIAMACEWSPTVPKRLSRRGWREYRAGRDAALAELSRITGERCVVVEI